MVLWFFVLQTAGVGIRETEADVSANAGQAPLFRVTLEGLRKGAWRSALS